MVSVCVSVRVNGFYIDKYICTAYTSVFDEIYFTNKPAHFSGSTIDCELVFLVLIAVFRCILSTEHGVNNCKIYNPCNLFVFAFARFICDFGFPPPPYPSNGTTNGFSVSLLSRSNNICVFSAIWVWSRSIANGNISHYYFKIEFSIAAQTSTITTTTPTPTTTTSKKSFRTIEFWEQWISNLHRVPTGGLALVDAFTRRQPIFISAAHRRRAINIFACVAVPVCVHIFIVFVFSNRFSRIITIHE